MCEVSSPLLQQTEFHKPSALQANDAFVPAWMRCTAKTAVRHLDVEAPNMFQPLYELEKSGAWGSGEVPCTEGDYGVDDYWSWKHWRDNLEGVQAIGEVG